MPKLVSKGSNNITYIYSAAGEKLAKKMKDGTYQYYAGNMVYKNDKSLDYLLFDEGLVTKTSSVYSYEYHLKDHLGNTRVTFQPNGSATTTTQVAEYYPFGSNYLPVSPAGTNKYLYNGKEKQDDVLSSTALDWYDYGARFYDQAGVHWLTVDPHAENYYSWSPYHYAANNPISMIDPDGRDWYQSSGKDQAVMWKDGNAEIEGYSLKKGSFSVNIDSKTSLTYKSDEFDPLSLTENVLSKEDFKSQMLPNWKKKPDKDGKREGDCFYESGEMVKASGAISGGNDGKDSERGANYINSEIDAGHSTRVHVNRSHNGAGVHWVAISSRTTDIKFQTSSYGFFDPAGRNASEGTTSSFSMGTNGTLKGVADVYSNLTNYEVVGVRNNN